MIKELIITYLPGLSLVDFDEVIVAVHSERCRRDEIRAQSMPAPKLDRKLSQTDNVRAYSEKYNCSISLAFTMVRKYW